MVCVLELDAEVVLPAVIDGGVGNVGGAELSGEFYAGTLERKYIVGVGDAVDRDDADEENAGDGEPVVDSLLIVADETEQGDRQQSEGVAVESSMVVAVKRRNA